MVTKEIKPHKWYIMDIRDPKKPRVPAVSFLFKELAIKSIERTLGTNPLVFPIFGEELLKWDIHPRNGAHTSFCLSFKMYEFAEGMTKRQKKTFRKYFRRKRRKEKYAEVKGLKSSHFIITWGDKIPKVIRDEKGNKVNKGERLKVMKRERWRLLRQYDHL